MRVAIIGMGIMGCTLAERLLSAGIQVTMFDKNKHHNCSYAAAGLLTPFSELDKSELLIMQLGSESLNQHWPRLAEKLQQSHNLQKKGSIILFHPQDKPVWDSYKNRIFAQIDEHNAKVKQIYTKQIQKLEPELTKFNEAIYCHEEGHLNSQAILACLQNLQNLQTIKTEVVDIRPGSITTTQQTYKFDLVCDCRGLGAKDIFQDLRPVRGELIHIQAKEVNLQRPIRLLHPRYSLYIVPRANNHYLVGASELESSDPETISVRSSLELLTAINFVHPGFLDGKIIKNITQLRPTLKNHLPQIKYCQQFIAINGLYRHGYLIAPAIANDVLNFLQNSANYPQLWEQIDDKCFC